MDNILPENMTSLIEKLKSNEDLKKLLKIGGFLVGIWLIYKLWKSK